MIRKFFPLDKNYILEQSQLKTKAALLKDLCKQAVKVWHHQHNSLGLDDDFSKRLMSEPAKGYQALEPFYELLAGIYRLKYGDNQLEILWSGEDQLDQYAADWSRVFRFWTAEFSSNANFVQAVLDLTYFLPKTDRPDLTGARLENFLLKYFNLHKSRTTGMVAARALA